MGREPVVWEGRGAPPVPESLRRYAEQSQQQLGTGTDGPVDLRGQVVSGGGSGGTGQPGQILAMKRGEGGTGGAGEVGTVRGAGPPASGPEAPARATEPPAERSGSLSPLPENVPLDLVDPLETPSSSYALGRELDAAGHVRPPGWMAHHIVAGNALDATPARDILKKFGIGINTEANGVYLPGGSSTPNPTGAAIHSRVHTDRYYKIVNERLRGAVNKADVEMRLAAIRRELLSGGLND